MTKPMHKSRSWRRVQKRVIGSTATRYLSKKNAGSRCAKCNENLKGTNFGISEKTERIFGNYLCANCVKQKLILEARQLSFNKE